MTNPADQYLSRERLEELSKKLPVFAKKLEEEDRNLLRACYLRGADALLDESEAKPVPISTFVPGGGRGNDWSIGDFQGRKRPPKHSY